MRTLGTFLLASLISLSLFSSALAEAEIADVNLSERVIELSASTLVGGAGWKAYDKILHQNYTRWAMGEVYEGREKFIRSLEEWWDYGMRVASRDIDLISVDRAGNLAIIRFKTTETFAGPDGPVEGFSGYVSNLWIEENGDWKLLSAEISSLQREDVVSVEDD